MTTFTGGMRRPGFVFGVMVGVLRLVLCAGAADAQTHLVTVTGTWSCLENGVITPLAGARIDIRNKKDFGEFWDGEPLASTFTDQNGRYSVAVNVPDGCCTIYNRVALNDGKQGDVTARLVNFPFNEEWAYNVRDVVRYAGQAGNVLFGDRSLVFGGGTNGDNNHSPCAVWRHAHAALADYRQVIGEDPPAGKVQVKWVWGWALGALTNFTDIIWPPFNAILVPYGKVVVSNTIFHEFGHTVRHAFDGDEAHFLFDKDAYFYTQNHNPYSHTNTGFAFNEGWAEFWEGVTGYTTGDGSNMNYEGNVADALHALSECTDRFGHPLGKPAMVSVLRAHPGNIHAFSQFLLNFQAKYGATCHPDASARVQGLKLPSIEAKLEGHNWMTQLAAGYELVEELSMAIANLEYQVAAAYGDAVHALPCHSVDCRGAIAAGLLPIGLQARLDVATLARAQLESQLDPAFGAHFRGALNGDTMTAHLTEVDETYRRQVANIRVSSLESALTVLASLRGMSGEAETIARELESELFALRSMAAEGRVPPVLIEPPAVFGGATLRPMVFETSGRER